MIPNYINCKNKKIEHCEFYILQDCPETCAYSLDIGGLGIGAIVNLPSERDGLEDLRYEQLVKEKNKRENKKND